MDKIAFAGTFDPITKGHTWVIEEGLRIANRVVVMIAHNNTKKTMFSEMQRKNMIQAVMQERGIANRVDVILIRNEYVAQSAMRLGCDYLIRGIRSALDFDYETLIQKTNTDVLYGAKTLFVMPPRDLESVSSSFVKSLIGPVGWHWHVKSFLDKPVYEQWVKKYIRETASNYLIDHYFTKDNKESLFNAVFTAYSGEKRHYHNLDHIAHCLQELEWAISNYEISPQEAEYQVLSILLHDSIQQAGNLEKTDEQLSAEFTENLLSVYSGVETVKSLELATGHLSGNQVLNENQKLMCSIDLAILGQRPEIYDEYVKSVRQEYDVSYELWKQGRAKALKTLLEKEELFPSKYFTHYETMARQNLQRELNSL